jgi:hypothetical protein
MMRFRIAKFHLAGSADVLVRIERETRKLSGTDFQSVFEGRKSQTEVCATKTEA